MNFFVLLVNKFFIFFARIKFFRVVYKPILDSESTDSDGVLERLKSSKSWQCEDWEATSERLRDKHLQEDPKIVGIHVYGALSFFVAIATPYVFLSVYNSLDIWTFFHDPALLDLQEFLKRYTPDIKQYLSRVCYTEDLVRKFYEDPRKTLELLQKVIEKDFASKTVNRFINALNRTIAEKAVLEATATQTLSAAI